MGLRISGKQMEMGEAFRTRIDQRIEDAISKYFDGGFSGHVTVEKTGGRFSADCRIHLDTGMELQAEGRAMDPQLAFDAAAERIEKRLRRYKRRLKSHQTVSPDDAAWTDVPYRVVAPAAEEDEEVPEDYAPAIVAETSLTLKTMSVADAVIELDTKESPVQVFRNAGTGRVNIVYRRSDGNIGWIDPSAVSGAGA